MLAVRVRELHEAAAAPGGGEEHLARGQELPAEAAVWEHPPRAPPGPRRPAHEPAGRGDPGAEVPPQVAAHASESTTPALQPAFHVAYHSSTAIPVSRDGE